MVLTEEDCKKIIQRYSNGALKFADFTIRPLGGSLRGFMGEHNKLTITAHDPINNKMKSVDFFLKHIMEDNPKHLEYVQELGVFRKEGLLYKDLLMDFSKLHKKPTTPQCYLVNPDKFIVLEDLYGARYTNQDDDLDLRHLKSVVETLAHFHASSIIFEEARCTDKPYRLVDNNQEALKEAFIVEQKGHPRYECTKNTIKSIAETMTLLPEFTNSKACADKLRKFGSQKLFDFVKPSSQFRNVVSHGDLWKNNIMFKEINGELHSLLVDYQFTRYAPPAFELLSTLYINTTTEPFNVNGTYLLEHYYQTFTGCLKAHQIDPEKILTRKDFQKSVEHFKIAALIEACMFSTIIFISGELSSAIVNDEDVFNEFSYTNRTKYVESEFATNPRFRRRYENILRQLIVFLQSYED